MTDLVKDVQELGGFLGEGLHLRGIQGHVLGNGFGRGQVLHWVTACQKKKKKEKEMEQRK